MLNKREMIFISLAFVAGVMFSECFNSRQILAQPTTTNYVIDIVNQKIAAVAADVKALTLRIANIEKNSTENTTKTAALATSIKQLVSLQKNTDADVGKLKQDVATLKTTVKLLKDAQAIQQK